MIPTDVSGSRLPGRLVADEQRRVVDERARDRDALLLAAGELVGERVHPVREPDHREHLGDLLADRAAALALHLERVGDVLGRACGSGSSLKSWKTQPMLRRSIGTFERFSRARSRPPTTILPLVASSSLSSRRTSVDFPEPEAPTTKTNSPLSMWKVTSRSAMTSGS